MQKEQSNQMVGLITFAMSSMNAKTIGSHHCHVDESESGIGAKKMKKLAPALRAHPRRRQVTT